RWSVGILLACLLLSLTFGILPVITKENILTRTTVLNTVAMGVGVTLMSSLLLLLINQTARGSRVFYILSLMMLVSGIFGLSFSLIKKADYWHALGLVLYGLPMFFLARSKNSKKYRSEAVRIRPPTQLIISMLSLILFFYLYAAKDIVNLWHCDRLLALRYLWQLSLGSLIIFYPIYWGLRWGDKIAFYLYCGLLCCGILVLITGLYVALNQDLALGLRIFNLCLSISFLSPVIFFFKKDVLLWYKKLQPAI
ncbi:hypothetical protein EBR43_13685, partial [bacterium]|nr:hypothetical protein [bacterium]